MSSGKTGPVARQVVRLYGEGSLAGMSEEQLLDRFVKRRDEVAFEALVARHGPMVLGVCRRLLRDTAEAEDAFQATFLVLVRRASSIRDTERLASWLFGVAHRVSKRARANATRWRGPDRGPSSEAAAVAIDPEVDELRSVLDSELSRLPEKYRDPLVLCYLEGCTHDEAAARLNWPVGTVRGRMARGRELLRGRLARRGFAPASAVLTGALTCDASRALPESLRQAAVHAGTAFQIGRSAVAGSVSAATLALADGVLRTMTMSQLKVATGVLIAGMLVGGAVATARQQGSADVKEGTQATALHPPVSDVPPPVQNPERRTGAATAELPPPRDVNEPQRPDVAGTSVPSRKPPMADRRPAGSDVIHDDPLATQPMKGGAMKLPPKPDRRAGELLERTRTEVESAIGELSGQIQEMTATLAKARSDLRRLQAIKKALVSETAGPLPPEDEPRAEMPLDPAGQGAAVFPSPGTPDGLIPASSDSGPPPPLPPGASPFDAENRGPAPGAPPSAARAIQPGDTLSIDVLEALPGRPLNGMRMVRPDGP